MHHYVFEQKEEKNGCVCEIVGGSNVGEVIFLVKLEVQANNYHNLWSTSSVSGART